MSLSSSFGARPTATPTPPATVQAGVRTLAAQYLPASGKVAARLPTVDPVGLQGDVVSLSREGLRTDGATLARTTSDNAQFFMNTFAQRLFGDQASTSKVAYNLKPSPVSISGGNGAPAATAEVLGPAFKLTQPARFTGAGQINTEDGRSFDFALKVKYEPRAESSERLQLRSKPPNIETPDVLMLTGKPLPEIEFPGSLDDLYKLLGRELRTEVSSSAGGAAMATSGELTLRLERLVDRAALLAPRARPDDLGISASERARAVAQSYATTGAGNPPTRA